MTNTLHRLEQAAVRIIDEMESGLETGKAFAIEQAPEVCREILAWEFWGNAMVAIPALLAAIILVCIAVKATRKMNSDYCTDGWILASAMCSIVSIVLIIVVCVSTACAIKPLIAPRLVIIEKLAEAAR